MLLTCPQCQNTYQLDDQIYAQQGGALCAQCQIPLVPVDNAGYDQQWQQGGDQWGQPQQNQWDQSQQQAQWNQQNQWQQQDQWNQQQQDQWNQQNQWQQQEQWNQQNQWQQQNQWNQQPQNQWQQQDQWNQQPNLPGDPPPEWGNPMPTMAFVDPVPNDNQIVNHSNEGGERTMAIDIDNGAWEQQVPQQSNNPPAAPAGDDWNMPDSWNKSPASAPAPAASKPQGIVIGGPINPSTSEGMTRQIDVSAVQKLYGDKVNPIKEFFRNVPTRHLIILGSVLFIAIVGFVVAAVMINREPENQVAMTDEDNVDPNAPKSFNEIVKDIRTIKSASFPVFDGEIAQSGSIVTVSSKNGIVYNEKKIADINDLKVSDGPFVEKIYKGIQSDINGTGPILFLFDEMMTMSSVYKIMYSMAVTSRPVYFAGITAQGLAMLDLTPCSWPDHGFTAFSECTSASVELNIKKLELTLKRINGDTPLAIDPDGTPHTELRDEISGDSVRTYNIAPGISMLRSSGMSAVRIVSDGDVLLNVFLSAVLAVRGDADMANVKKFFLMPVPLR